VVMWLVDTATVTTQGSPGSHDTANEEWRLQLAKTGDSDLATSGDFFMATDTKDRSHQGHPDQLLSPRSDLRIRPPSTSVRPTTASRPSRWRPECETHVDPCPTPIVAPSAPTPFGRCPARDYLAGRMRSRRTSTGSRALLTAAARGVRVGGSPPLQPRRGTPREAGQWRGGRLYVDLFERAVPSGWKPMKAET